LAFAPQVKFVMKHKGQAAEKTRDTVGASQTRQSVGDKNQSASESDGESSDDSVMSSEDEQETARLAKQMAEVASNDDDDDDELLVKKTSKTDKYLELQDSVEVMPDSAQSKVLCNVLL